MDSVDEGAGPPPEPGRVRIDFRGSGDRMLLDGDYIIPYLRVACFLGFKIVVVGDSRTVVCPS